MINKEASKTYFSHDDNLRLASLIAMYGSSNWSFIFRLMINKTKRQCRDRWTNYLNPSLNKNPFSNDENDLLLKKVDELGFQWKEISKYFQNRTEMMVKNKYKIM
jgi:hypothetical protein